MIWQRVICWGDSQTFGARQPIGMAELLASEMESKTGLVWDAVNRGVSGETIAELTRRYDDELIESAVQTVLIGTNDARDLGAPVWFREWVIRLLRKLEISEIPYVWMLIPPMEPGRAHFPYQPGHGNRLIAEYNEAILSVVPPLNVISAPSLSSEEYVDSVHFTVHGTLKIAKKFADWMVEQ